MEFVCLVPNRIEICAALHQRIGAVMAGDEPDSFLGQIELLVLYNIHLHINFLTQYPAYG